MNLFVGTWTANLEKSRRHANHQFHSATLRFDVSGDTVTLTHSGVNAAGKAETGTNVMCADGQDHVLAAAPDILVMARWAGSHTLETVAKRHGQVVGQGTYQLSDDATMLTATVAGTDGAGKPFEQVIVFDRG